MNSTAVRRDHTTATHTRTNAAHRQQQPHTTQSCWYNIIVKSCIYGMDIGSLFNLSPNKKVQNSNIAI